MTDSAAYAAQRGLRADACAGGFVLAGPALAGRLEVSLDELGRMSGIRASA